MRSLVVALTVSVATPALGQTRPTLIQNAAVFTDGRTKTESVLIRDGHIAAVGVSLTVPAGAEIVDATGLTLLPGFIDAHTHTTSPFIPHQALTFGVTTEIDLLCDPRMCEPLHAEQDRGPVTDRADVLSALLAVTAPGGHGTEYFPAPALSSADSAQAFVDARIAEGAKWIKIIYTGGSANRPFPNLDHKTLVAAIEAAHRRGKLAIIHVDELATAREAVVAGADGLAHSFADVDPDPDFARLMREHHAFMIPTLSVRLGRTDSAFYASIANDPMLAPHLSEFARSAILQGTRYRPASYASAERTIRALRDAGVPVLAGTDAPNLGTAHGASIHGEMELLVRAGLTPSQALVAATSAPADAFRLTDRGRIAAGLRADLVLVRGDPTHDIQATRNIVGIWKVGVRVDSTDRAPSTLPAAITGTITRTGAHPAESPSEPIAGVNVFLAETLEGAISDSTGHYRVVTSVRGPAQLHVRKVGFAAKQFAITVADTGARVDASLDPVASVLSAMNVTASAYIASDERGATLSARDVVSIPGATADLGRAIQTLPGVQSVDEGTALFVRGGDHTETRYFVNEVPIGVATRYENASGTFAGSVNPFLLQSTVFMSGGFGARFGNTLSSVVSLTTNGRPDHTSGTVSAGLGALSAEADVALPHGTGVRLAANRFQSSLMMRVNGETQPYDPDPNGHDLSGSAHFDYGSSGKFKLFVLDQKNQVGVGITDAAFTGSYYSQIKSTIGILSWTDTFGHWRIASSVARTRSVTDEIAGAFDLQRTNLGSFAVVRGERETTDFTVRTGVEWQSSDARFFGSIPKETFDRSPGARSLVGDSRDTANRVAAFVEADWHPALPLRVSVGARADHFSLGDGTAFDPRTSATWRLSESVSLIGALGMYHQYPEALAYDATFGTPHLPPMRDIQSIVGAQWESGPTSARLELYDKQYADLAQLSLTNSFVGYGTGRARGADLLLKGKLWTYMDARATLSYVQSRRTDPTTSIMAPAAFDVPYSFTGIVQCPLPHGWSAGVTTHAAVGRPFTAISAATFDSTRHIWIPTYDEPFGSRMPATFRTDAQVTRTVRLSPTRLWVTYLSVNNIFDRDNLYIYRYSPDYTKRLPVRSLFKRSFYFGMSLIRT